MLICPICVEPLASTGTSTSTSTSTSATLSCPRGHTFDVAREGYVNLLVGGVRGAAGDTKEMLRARRAFLERGFYAPLSEQVNAMAAHFMSANEATETRPISPAAERPASVVLDAGCGEGYYIGRLREALDARRGTGMLSYVGIDIAKEAARLAAKRHPAIRFAVADVKRGIPVETGAVALLLNVFAPRNPAELARVVAPGGMLLIAIPGPHHLAELRERYGLLGIEPEKQRHIAAQLVPGFVLAESATLEYTMSLSADDMYQLLTMTPNARHRERQRWQEAVPEPARVTASFVALAFRRKW